jgi:hypothetical protein
MQKEMVLGDYQKIVQVQENLHPGRTDNVMIAFECYNLGFERGREGVTEYPLQRIIDILTDNLETEKTVRFNLTSEGYVELCFKDGKNPAVNCLTLLPDEEEAPIVQVIEC